MPGPALGVASQGFSALRRPDSAALSAIAKPRSLTWVAEQQPSLDINDAVVLRNTPSTTVVLSPDDDGRLCMIRMRASGTVATICAEMARAVSEGIVNNLPGKVSGIVPDGVDQVTFTLSDGSSRDAQVVDHTFQAPPEAVGYTFVRGGETQTVKGLVPESQRPPEMVVVD